MDKTTIFKSLFIIILICLIVIYSIVISNSKKKKSLFTNPNEDVQINHFDSNNEWWLLSQNATAQQKMKKLTEKWGNPDRIELAPNKEKLTVHLNISTYGNRPTLYSATWLNKDNCDEIVIYEDIFDKYHPYKAILFVIVKKLIHVPDHLLGPLKYASETINIEQLRTTPEINAKYKKDGTKEKAMVSGSCASITISVLTLDFVIKMVDKYKNEDTFYQASIQDRMKEFREAYNTRVHDYLTTGKVGTFKDDWFDYKESTEYNPEFKGASNLGEKLF